MLGFRVVLGFVWCLGFKVLGFRVKGLLGVILGFVWCLGFGVLGFRCWLLRFLLGFRG